MDTPMNHIKNSKKSERIYVIPDALIFDIKKHPLANSLYFSDIGCFENIANHSRERITGCDQAIFVYCFKGSGYYIENDQKKTWNKTRFFLFLKTLLIFMLLPKTIHGVFYGFM